MPNVKFLQGTQSDLAKYLVSGNTAATEGAFYLTSDTNRLYIGKDIGSGTVRAVPVNQGVITVANINALPGSGGEQGQFYYAESENVLCVYSGNQWVQINPDNNTIADDRVVTANYTANTKTVAITDIIYNNDSSQLSANWDIKAGSGLDASVSPKYTPAKKFHAGVTYYTKSGNVYTVASVNSSTFNPATHYEQTGFTLTLTPAAYVLSADLDASTGTNIELKLSNGDSTSDSIATIKPGSNVTFGTNNGDVTISADDTKIDTATLTAKTGSADGFDLKVKDTSGKTATGSFDPVVRVGSTGEFSDTHFINGMATLPVYSKTQVDNLFKTFNAMEWQGVKTSGNMPTSNVKNGYVYMAGTGGLSTGAGDPVTASAGDLIIATGTEGSDGYIPTANIQWQIVDAGNDLQDAYTVTNTTHGILFKKNNGTIGGMIAQGDGSYLSTSDSTDGSGSRVVTISHNELHQAAVTNTTPSNETQVSQSTMDINVPTISYDKAGHITNLGTTKYTVTDTHANIANHTIGATVSGSTATITDSFTVDGANKSASYNMSSSSLSLSASNGNLTVDMTWGSF